MSAPRTVSIRLPIAELRAKAPGKPAGYLDEILGAGRIDGDDLVIDVKRYRELVLKFSPPGLGDRVAAALKPLVEWADAALGTDLANCGGCAERQAALNELFPDRQP